MSPIKTLQHKNIFIMKTLTNCYISKVSVLIVAAGGFLAGCHKEIRFAQQLGEVSSIADDTQKDSKIYVSDVNQLYAAVNNPDNAGNRIVLSPGTYVLSSSFPNGGRLELQQDMSLQGQPGQPDSVVIDASPLPASSFLLPPTSFPGALRTGVIRIGNGTNAIEWLTVKAPPTANALSAIESDMVTTPQTQVRVAHCIISGGQIAIDIRNRDEASNGRVIEAEIADNELFGNTFGFGQAIGIQNSRDVSGAVINAVLRNNYIHGNRMGIRAYNVVANQSTITIHSNDDRFEDNGLGLAIISGFNEYPIFTANNNILSFEAQGTTIMNNMGEPAPPSGTAQPLPGGVLLTGGQVTVNSLPGTVNNNTLDVNFYGCKFEGNLAPYDINVFGARSTYPSPNPAGINNVVNLKLMGISANATVMTTASTPAEPAGTDVVNVFRN
jgi:hypothetical protein